MSHVKTGFMSAFVICHKELFNGKNSFLCKFLFWYQIIPKFDSFQREQILGLNYFKEHLKIKNRYMSNFIFQKIFFQVTDFTKVKYNPLISHESYNGTHVL